MEPTLSSSEPSDGPAQVHIGRQSIYDVRGRVAGYELLFRDSADAAGAARRGAYATSRVIVNAFTEFGLESLVGTEPCFINLTREFVTGDLPLPFPPGPVVLEILESVPVDDQVVSGILALVDAGYRVALDGFVLGQGHEQLLTVASFVKIDISTRGHESLAAAVGRCRRYPDVKLIAERVETRAQMRMGRRLGFDLFQGYALTQPQTLSTRADHPQIAERLKLFGELNAPDVDLDRVVAAVAADPVVGKQLVRACGGATGALAHPVTTVAEAVSLLGVARVKQWVALILISEVTAANDDHLATITTRARLCQTVGERLGVAGDLCFTVGLLAGLAEQLDQPVGDLVAGLPLSPELGEALLHGTGKLGQVLEAVRAYERRDLASFANGPLPMDELAHGYLDALAYYHRTVAGSDTKGGVT